MAPGIVNHAIHTRSETTLPTVLHESYETSVERATSELFSLSGKTFVVTGAGRGLGITLAAAILEVGGNVACLDILPEPSPSEWLVLQKIAKSSNLHLSYHQCDITDEVEVQRIFVGLGETAQQLGAPFSGVVACAGIQHKMSALDYTVADFERIMRVNVTGTFLTVKHAAKIMVETRVGGSIVLVASMSGSIANRGLTCTAYNTSKSALHQMSRSLAQEWGKYGIRVNTLSPGYIRTAMTDALLAAEPEVEKTWMAGALLGRLGAPEDFRAPTVFLLAPGSSFMTGADLRVDGGHCASA